MDDTDGRAKKPDRERRPPRDEQQQEAVSIAREEAVRLESRSQTSI